MDAEEASQEIINTEQANREMLMALEACGWLGLDSYILHHGSITFNRIEQEILETRYLNTIKWVEAHEKFDKLQAILSKYHLAWPPFEVYPLPWSAGSVNDTGSV
jgi:hypothetical protein